MVPEVEAVEHAAGEPARDITQDRDSLGARRPRAELELVDLVAGLPAEQRRELAVRGTQEVDDHRIGGSDHVVGAVLLGDADQEPRRMDAALRGEADQATAALAVGADGGDDEHRRVEPADQLLEGLLAQAAKSATRSRTPWSECPSRRCERVAISRSAGRLSVSTDALKRLIPRPRASSASRMPSIEPMRLPCIASATVTATSAVSGSSFRRT